MSTTLGFQVPTAEVQRLAILVKELADILGRLIAKPNGPATATPSFSPKPAPIVPIVAAPVSPLASVKPARIGSLVAVPASAPVTFGEAQQAYRALGQVKGGAVAILNVLGNFRLCHLGDANPDQYAALAGAFNDALVALGGPPQGLRRMPRR